MLKKVVVLYPYPDTYPVKDRGPISSVGQKIFQSKNGELRADNTDAGCLVIKKELVDTQNRNVTHIVTIAVFKNWIYWEDVSK